MTYLWPSEDGWPYPDTERDLVDPEEGVDHDVLLLRTAPPHVFAGLDPLERQVITSHYGLGGAAPRSMKELHHELGLPRRDLRDALAGGLAKLRTQLRA